jgi:hypothetical protein
MIATGFKALFLETIMQKSRCRLERKRKEKIVCCQIQDIMEPDIANQGYKVALAEISNA